MFVLLICFAFNANAGIEKDDKTFSIFAALISSDASDTLFVSAAGGYFYTDVIELAGTVTLIDSNNFSSVGFGGNANMYFPGKDPDLIPYAGGGATLTVDDFDTTFGINGQVGIKQFISEDVAMNYQAQLILSSDTIFIMSAGITIFFD